MQRQTPSLGTEQIVDAGLQQTSFHTLGIQGGQIVGRYLVAAVQIDRSHGHSNFLVGVQTDHRILLNAASGRKSEYGGHTRIY